ncbi:MAG: hypothetical protein ACRDPG_02910 [Nocardioidaceae bacterium]
MSSDPPTKRVFFHIGAPKTGTTYLQSILRKNKGGLARAGVLYPYESISESFDSMIDFRKTGWAGKPASRYDGAWENIAARIRSWHGHTVIVSHELLCSTALPQIKAGLAAVQPAEIHVIFSARDFGRALVSDWQEQIKHKHTVTLERFVDDLVSLGLDAPEPFGEYFWGMHDAAYVLDHWSKAVPKENLHVVTVPAPGGPKTALWERFAAITGIDAGGYDTEADRTNSSLGVVETELVRRINLGVQRMASEVYDPLVRLYLAEEVLGRRSPHICLPPQHYDWVVKRSRQLVEEIALAGYPIEGDLEDLMPVREYHSDYISPTDLDDGDLGHSAIIAATGMLRRAAATHRRSLRLEGDPRLPPASWRSRIRRALGRLRREVRRVPGSVASRRRRP